MSPEPLFEPVIDDRPNRYPVPEGYATPTELTHILRAKKIISNLSPQQIYTGFIKKRDSDFPWEKNLDGRTIVPVEEGTRWIVRWLQEKAEKEAAKAAAAARKAEAALIATSVLDNNHDEDDESIENAEIEPQDEWGAEWSDLA